MRIEKKDEKSETSKFNFEKMKEKWSFINTNDLEKKKAEKTELNAIR